MDYVAEVHRLTNDFFVDYPETRYPELMHKRGRPYNCLLIDLHLDYYICIPFRSAITHKNAYMFKNSLRSQQTKSGLDYSKAVILTDGHYFDTVAAVIDQDEYNEAITNMSRIVNEITEYVDDYISHVKGIKILHQREFQRRYRFSTLSYFHKQLGI